MNVEPFLVADTLLGVIAQRLVRTLCPFCRQAYVPTDTELVELGCTPEQIAQVPNATIYKAVGCFECNDLGYTGRTGIYELLVNSEDIQRLVIVNAPSGQIKKLAIEQGMFSLFDDGMRKVFQGVTTFEEIKRVTTASEL
jgi:type II secretory ATPase GspE/PulE/Tfp pilus assembly ATPase PilB-like protein